jgi:hypothetical protein
MYAEKNYRSGKKNQRMYPRLACRVGVELQAAEGEMVVGSLANISAGGCYVQTGVPLPAGKEMDLRFSSPTGDLHVKGTVVRNNPGQGIGVKFCDTSLAERKRVECILKLAEGTLAPDRTAQQYIAWLSQVER